MYRSKSLLALFVSIVGSVALAGPTTQVPNNVPPWLAQATLVGPSDGNKQVAVAIYLQLNNVAGLESFIHDLYTPGTASYGQFLSPQQFRTAYSPAASAVVAVQKFLSQGGLKVTYTPANGMYVEATGSVSQIAKAFEVSQDLYNFHGNTLRANKEPPTIPASLTSYVSFIEGLDDSETLIQSYVQRRRGAQPGAPPGPGYGATPPPCSTYWADHSATVIPSAYQYGSSLPWANCGYIPQQMQAAYGVNQVPWNGAGVRVGVTDAFASPTIVDDVNRFSAHYGLPLLTSSNFQQIVVPGTYNYPPNGQGAQSWYIEETLDIEWVHAMAPGATIVFAGAQNIGVANGGQDEGSQTLPHALIHLIDNHLADVITNSWGYFTELNYGLEQPMEAAFMQAAAEGISVLFGSGDFGDNLLLGRSTLAQAGYPGGSPFVTAVGGTTLAIYDAAGDKNEWGWGNYLTTLLNAQVSADGTQVLGSLWSSWPPPFYGGSGGGISLNFLQPYYQQGVVPGSLATSTVDVNGNLVTFTTPHRDAPDIAMEADPLTGVIVGETFAISGDPINDSGCKALSNTDEYCEYNLAGTSLASPLFAGVLALTNQARFAAGKGPVGFANPALYRLPTGPSGSGVAIIDVVPPKTPMASIFNIEVSPGVLEVQLLSINSVPVGTNGQVIKGADTSLQTAPGWDNVTGLGTPNVPAFIAAFSSLP